MMFMSILISKRRFSQTRQSPSSSLLLSLPIILIFLFSPRPLHAFQILPLPSLLPPPPSSLPLPVKLLLPYTLYSVAVDMYTKHKVQQMQTIPSLLPIPNLDYDEDKDDKDVDSMNKTTMKMTTTTTRSKIKKPFELRKTISKWNNIVLHPTDRQSWNEFIVTKNDDKERRTWSTATTITTTQDHPLCGNYDFAYRSYVNFEEANAIACSPFFNWKQFLFVMIQKGRLTISKKEESLFVDDDSSSSSSSKEMKKTTTATTTTQKRIHEETIKNDNVLLVTNVERFRFLFLMNITLTWYGKLVLCEKNKNDQKSMEEEGGDELVAAAPPTQMKKLQVKWTKTKMNIRGPMKFLSYTIDNPKVSVELSSQPWDILKVEDGMICFQRGDIGYLVYDKKKENKD